MKLQLLCTVAGVSAFAALAASAPTVAAGVAMSSGLGAALLSMKNVTQLPETVSEPPLLMPFVNSASQKSTTKAISQYQNNEKVRNRREASGDDSYTGAEIKCSNPKKPKCVKAMVKVSNSGDPDKAKKAAQYIDKHRGVLVDVASKQKSYWAEIESQLTEKSTTETPRSTQIPPECKFGDMELVECIKIEIQESEEKEDTCTYKNKCDIGVKLSFKGEDNDLSYQESVPCFVVEEYKEIYVDSDGEDYEVSRTQFAGISCPNETETEAKISKQ